ncbi:ROK family protein [Amaricoccus tamworthensis]|uniref:ROK family protein n=1 Tax=Amaricoccus tamworthensis TaxID=57002 RepID=UPI003C7AE452
MAEDEPGATATAPVQRGTNQAGMRAFNERLVLSLVRRHRALAKSAIAGMTGLSVQTVSVIMRQLEADDLLLRGEPQRGKVGQPRVPMSINPEGAFFVGVKIGRRSLQIMLVDFEGGVRHSVTHGYDFPKTLECFGRVRSQVAEYAAMLGPKADRLAGLGLAMPSRIWEWADEIGADQAELARWADIDIAAELALVPALPVYVQDDATAACGAELAFGNPEGLMDFLHVHVGAFIGGGIVLNGALHTGRTGKAAALWPLPVSDGKGGTVPLLDRASLILLERRVLAAGLPVELLHDLSGDWESLGDVLEAWLDGAGPAIAQAVVAAASVLELGTVVVDGALPDPVRDRLVARVRDELELYDMRGFERPEVRTGTVGPDARAIGGASLPLFDRYLVDPGTLAVSGGRQAS